VSVWEIATKFRSGRLPLPEPPDRLVPTERDLRGVTPLAFDEESALQVLRLPALHRDPFDRMLISQAIAGGWRSCRTRSSRSIRFASSGDYSSFHFDGASCGPWSVLGPWFDWILDPTRPTKDGP
jgi:hypothetical protein